MKGVDMTTTDYALLVFEDISLYLIDQVKNKSLSIDDRNIWDQRLHRYSDSDWLLLVNIMERINQKRPEYIKPFQLSTFEQIRDEILKHHRTTPRVMDKRDRTWDNKKLAWKGIQCMREVWCQIFDIPEGIIEMKTRSYRKTSRWDQ